MTNNLLKLGVVAGDRDQTVYDNHPLTLAYIGDVVWELYVRHHLLARGFSKPHDLQRESVHYVSARAQANVLHKLMTHLTAQEKDIARRGRNAKSKTAPKNMTIVDYRHSTAVETLVGHLYLTNKLERLTELMEWAFEIVAAERRTDNG